MQPLAKFAIPIGAAGICAALLSHALLQLAAKVPVGASAFEHHAHGGVAPIVFVSALLFSIVATAFVRDARSATQTTVYRVSERLGFDQLLTIGVSIAAIAGLTLLAMESCESATALLGCEWLGGNALVGLLVVLLSSIAATFVVKTASDARSIALDRAIAIFSKVFRAIASRAAAPSAFRKHRERTAVLLHCDYVARSAGLRAPPLSTF